MAFISTVINRDLGGAGSKAMIHVTYLNNSASTGGDVITGLVSVEGFYLQPFGAVVSANQPTVNETFPLANAGGAVTIVTSANESGSWIAIGY